MLRSFLRSDRIVQALVEYADWRTREGNDAHDLAREMRVYTRVVHVWPFPRPSESRWRTLTVVEQRPEWWVAIGHAFATHVREEVAILQAYEQLLMSTTDPGTRYVLRLVLEDERRHHEVFEQLEAAARADESRATATVAAPSPPVDERERLLAATERFLAIEHDDEVSLRHLRRELKPAAEDTLWRLLVELMELDTQKHVRILEYLQKRLRSLR